MNKIKKGLIIPTLLAGILLVGCSDHEKGGNKEESTEEVSEEGVVSSLVIPKPTILEVEDDKFNTSNIQDKLDDINEGKRLDGYEKQNKEELVLEVPKGFKTNDEVYNKVEAKDLAEGTYLVYVGRDSCPYCNLLRVHLDQVVEQLDLNLDYIDTDDIENEETLVGEYGLESVPQIQVFHEGEVIAEYPQSGMYLEQGADYESLANGLGDLVNIYLSEKHNIDLN